MYPNEQYLIFKNISSIMRFVFSLFLLASTLYSRDFYEGDSLVREGVHAFYNYEYKRSVSILTEAKSQYPSHPGVHLVWAASRWIQSQTIDDVDIANTQLELDLELIAPVYADLVETYPHDPNYRLYQGSALGLGARVTLGKKEWFKTLYRAYKGFSIIHDISEKSPEIIDAKLPIGIIQYYAGISNALLKWAVQLYGLNSSKDAGLNEISEAANGGDWSWIEAKGILSFLYLWVEDEPIMAYKHAKDLVENFPENYYFNLLYLETLIRTDKLDETQAIINSIESLSHTLTDRQRQWYHPYLNYEKALLAFHKKQYTTSLAFVEKSIESYSAELDIVLGNAYLLQGKNYDKLNKWSKAKTSYKLCVNLDNFSSAMGEATNRLKKINYK
ncbi:MAG: hypothetical protein HOB40_03845 [Candidatus Marinimicrobia bacterium]|jgi:hypothetical protein|nr:hypothetical protein [Candidatus Neomarinimicrobiota bacterium]MBT7822001.1 hypothetical protein [Candidatus Neomarinimicrobiota bacterium]